MGSSKFEIAILVDAKQGNAAIKGVNSNLQDLERQAATSGAGMSGAWEKAAAGSAAAGNAAKTSGTAALLSLRAMKSEAASLGTQLKKIGPIMDSVFAPIRMAAYILPGLGIAGIIMLFGDLLLKILPIPDSLLKWAESSEEVAKRNAELTKSIKEQNSALDDYYDKLEKSQRQRSMVGLSGVARSAAEFKAATDDVRKAKSEVETFMSQVNRLELELARLDKTRVVGGKRELTPEYIAKSAELSKAQEALVAASMTYGNSRQDYLTKQAELRQAQKEESEKRIKEEADRLKKAVEEDNRLRIDAMRAREGLEASSRESKIALERATNDAISKMQQRQLDEDEREWQRYWEKRKSDVESLALENENMTLSRMRQGKDYGGVMGIELKRLDEMKALHSDNAEALAQIEERKKLVIMDINDQIARDAQSKFEKTAQSIEGFVQRTFLTARSFSDVWKQALSQIASYAVSTVSKMVAAWTMGMQRMSPAGAPAGSGGAMSGFSGMLGSVMSGGGSGYGGSVGTPPFFPSGSGGAGGGFNPGGFMGQGGGLSGMKSFLGITPNVGAGFEGPMQSFGQLGMGGKLSQLGKSNAAMMGGAMLAMAGLQRGGLSGLGMTAAGGALIGFKFGGGIGAAIGGAIGAGAGLVRMLIGSAEDKAKSKIKAAYGVSISDKGVLRQVVEMSKAQFGGNLDMAVRSKSVQDLVRLYAMTTGQGTGKLPQQMTSSTLMQSGGTLAQQRQYINGMSANMPGGLPVFHRGTGPLAKDTLAFLRKGESVTPDSRALPGADFDSLKAGGFGGLPITIVVPGAKDFFKNETVTVIAKNPRAVQSAGMAAARSNFNRRQLAALQLSPGTITA